MATAPSSSDEVTQVSSVPLKQWAAGLVQAFHDLTSSLCSSMTQYLMIHQRSLYNHPPAAGLLPRARILVTLFGITDRLERHNVFC